MPRVSDWPSVAAEDTILTVTTVSDDLTSSARHPPSSPGTTGAPNRCAEVSPRPGATWPLPPVVAGGHARHGHVGAVREEDEEGQHAGQAAEQAEPDDA